MAACNVAAGCTRCMAAEAPVVVFEGAFQYNSCSYGTVSGKFNLIFRCDSCSKKSDGRRAKEKDVEVKKRLFQCARCDKKVGNADIFDGVLV